MMLLLDRDALDRPMLGVLLKKDNLQQKHYSTRTFWENVIISLDLSVLLPTFGVGVGDASINGMDNSS